MSLLGRLAFPLWMGSLIWAYYEQTSPVSSTGYPDMTEEEFALLVERVAEAQYAKQQSDQYGKTVTDFNSAEALDSVEGIEGTDGNILNYNG